MNYLNRARIASARTFLFVPASRPDRFDKAVATGADVVLIDLEDAVAPAEKAAARESARRWLESGKSAMVRVNAADTEFHTADVEMAVSTGAPIMVAKAESPQVLHEISSRRADLPIVPLIETARGVATALALCELDNIVRPAFGHIDLSAALGIDPTDRQALLLARSALVLAASASSCAGAVDGVTTALEGQSELEADIAHARSLGMTGKMCIHPRQVEVAHTLMQPSGPEVAWARGVLAAASADGSITSWNGHMIDAPVVARARQIVWSARRA